MKYFNLPTHIQEFKSFEEFVKTFEIEQSDCIVTHRFLYDSHMKSMDIKADFVMQEDFGTGEPNDVMMDAMRQTIAHKNHKRIIAIGGGTVIDIAKVMIAKGVAPTAELFDKTAPFEKSKQLIVIPTTCGTGSEVTNITIAEIKSKKTKMGLALDALFPDYAILIPDFLRNLPFTFFLYSSIDAMIHAIESYVSPNANDFTRLLSKRAMELILKGYLKIAQKGEMHRMELLEDFMIGSNYAGIAFGNTGVGAVHALSYPLGGAYHVPHGEANYAFFTEVFKVYGERKPEGVIKDLNLFLSDLLECEPKNVYVEIEKLLERLIRRKPLKEHGMKPEEIEIFADGVISTQQRLLNNNYVPLSRDEIRDIYKQLY